MKEKTIIDLVERGEKLCIGVRYNQNNEEYTVYLATESHEFIEDINIWSGGRLKVFADPRSTRDASEAAQGAQLGDGGCCVREREWQCEKIGHTRKCSQSSTSEFIR